MPVEIWPEHVTDRSWKVLSELNAKASPVLIGGWAVYLWTGALKSAYVDLFMTDDGLWKIEARIRKHPKLKKYHAVIDGVDVDIYTPSLCGLAVPAADVYANRWYALVREFNVLLPEPLLILKCEAARSRWGSRKGFKDRCDILSLLRLRGLDPDLFRELLLRYRSFDVMGTLRRVVQQSVEEYEVLGLSAWRGRREALRVLRMLEGA
jgi:hypothetical protein